MAGNGGKRAASGPDASTGKGKARKEENAASYGMRNVQSSWWQKYCVMYYEMQHCAVLRGEEWAWQFRWSIPAPGDGDKCGKRVGGGLGDENCEE